MSSETKVTEADFKAYIVVQESGMFNMFDPRARQATGLSKNVYLEIIKNYQALKEHYGYTRRRSNTMNGPLRLRLKN